MIDNNLKTSLDYLGKNKIKATRWSPEESQKFYDANVVFGNDQGYIHSIIYDSKARKRYENIDDFKERDLG